ncbi:ANL family adenylate-forming protein [Polynucleobacter sphagniphilus]|uniref:ANL family adenylate-forming protein n=1 Tax=Polynucleobacter sphagniphilus TaxID=1743169 RepID=UPI0024056F4F|nr:fatty acid--CoA ligase family protein [Polynucleobacter sphagniphilus]MDF9787840.1 acyl-coenzyme A synthetase/AMP-(fatty) acid ligase [Polynucleobacter sphagniphilus]
MKWLLSIFESAINHSAFIHDDRVVTYGEVLKNISSYLTDIQGSGVKEGELVVILGDYSPEVFCYILALALNNNIIIPLARGGIIEESEALGVSGCDWLVEFDASNTCATLKKHEILVKSEMLDEFKDNKTSGLIVFSSGSTGRPKAMLHDFNRVAEKFKNKRLPVIAIPFLMIDHFGGINTILAITSSLGTLVTVKDRSVQNICRAIERYAVELLPTTPSFLTLLAASGSYKNFRLDSLKKVTYGTEVMPQSTLDRIKKIIPNAILQQTYGLSEVGVLGSRSREDGSLWVKIGGDGFETKVMDGVLWVKSKYRMIGYLNAPSNFDAEGWFNTQDQVEVDGDYFRILGRVTDIINVGGQKVYPAEVESIILEMDNIKDAAVFGEKNNLLGQVVVAKVSLESPENIQILKKRIRQNCLGRLANYKIPTKILITEISMQNSRSKKVRKV